MRKPLAGRAAGIATIILVLAFACSTGKAAASAISLFPVADHALIDIDLDGIFDRPSTANILGYLLTSPLTSTTPIEIRSALEFRIGSIPHGSHVTSALLHLNLSSFGINPDAPIPHALEIHGYTGDGAVTVDDVIRLNRVAGPIVSADFFVLQAALARIDVTSFIQPLVTDGGAFAGFMIRTTTDSVGGIDSIESAAGQLPFAFPTLTVVFESGAAVAEPPIFALLALVVLALACTSSLCTVAVSFPQAR